jgi:hypothetical protein
MRLNTLTINLLNVNMSGTTTASDWAKKEVLDRIAIATENSAESLRVLSRLKDTGMDNLTRGAKAAGAATAGMASDVSRSGKSFGSSLNDLRKTLQQTTWQQEQAVARARQMGSSLSTGTLNAGSMLQNFSDRLSGTFAIIPVFGASVGAAVGALTGVITQLFQTREAFIALNQSGIMFGGSVARFNQAMGDAGLSSEQFSAIAQQSGQALRIFGETRFLQSTTALRNTFLDLGLTIQQGNEYFAEYIENSRLMGNLYMSTRAQEQAAFERTIRQQQELAILTGASVSEQRRAARERAASAQYRAMMMALPAEEQARLRQVSTALAGTGMDQKTIEAAIMQGAFGRTLPEFGRLMSLLPREMADSIQNFVRTGNAENQQAFIQTIARQSEQLRGDPQRMQTFALLSTGSQLEGTIASITQMLTQLQSSANLTPEQRADLERLRERGRLIDESTRAIGTAQETLTRALGMISAQINRLVTDHVVDRFAGAVQRIGDTIVSISTAAEGEGFRAFARQMGAAAEGGGMRIAGAFDTGIFAGLGEVFNVLVIEPFMAALARWSAGFIEDLRSIVPRWLQGSTPTRAEQIVRSEPIQTEISRIQERGIDPQSLIPQPPPVPAPPEPLRITGTIPARRELATQAETLTNEQIAAMQLRIQQLEQQATTARGAREMEITNEMIELLSRIERSMRETAGNTR